MKTGAVYELDERTIPKGGADETAQKLLEAWVTNGGFLHDDLVGLSSLLLLFDGIQEDGSPPQMLLCGENALAKRLLGDEWAEAPKTAVSALEQEYIALIARGYKRAAVERRPVFEYVTTNLQYGDDPLLQLRYQRLILPFQTLQGATFLFGYSHDVGTRGPLRGYLPSDKCLHWPELQNAGHASPCGRASFPK